MAQVHRVRVYNRKRCLLLGLRLCNLFGLRSHRGYRWTLLFLSRKKSKTNVKHLFRYSVCLQIHVGLKSASSGRGYSASWSNDQDACCLGTRLVVFCLSVHVISYPRRLLSNLASRVAEIIKGAIGLSNTWLITSLAMFAWTFLHLKICILS